MVAYPEYAWGTSWQDMVLISSKAMGLEDEGAAAVEELEAEIDAAFANYPELAGATILFSWVSESDMSTVGFYTAHDTRAGFLTSVGPANPELVETVSAQTAEFYSSISAEEADQLNDVDLFVTYGEPDTLIAALQADALLGQIPAIAAGHVAILPDSTPLAASANPSPLSIGWGVDDYFALLAAPLQ